MRSSTLFCLIPFVAGYQQNYYAPYAYAGYGYPLPIATYATKTTGLGNLNAIAPTRTNNGGGGPIVGNVRTLSNQVQAILRHLASDPSSAVFVNRIINDKDNICLGNLEDALTAIETGTQLLERAGGDVEKLITKVNGFGGHTAPASAARAVADLLRILEPVVKKIAPENPSSSICAASPSQAIGSLKSIATLLGELSNTNQLPLNYAVRSQLLESVRRINAVINFLNQLGAFFSNFKQICTPEKQYNILALSTLGDLMANLGDLFTTLGGIQKGQQIKKGREIVYKIMVSLNLML